MLSAPSGDEVKDRAGEGDPGDEQPHPPLTERRACLETDRRRERHAAPAGGVRRPEIDAPQGGRGHPRHERLGGRRPQHLAEHDHEQDGHDHRQRVVQLEQEVGRAHQEHPGRQPGAA